MRDDPQPIGFAGILKKIQAEEQVVESVRRLASEADLHHFMRIQARKHAEEASWDRVFQVVYEAYAAAADLTVSHLPAAPFERIALSI